ncbi:MAG TPA: glycine betaine ABC transporter substrate-binding protein [Flexivirga sp.]|uniref:glycine betaine ABC transporter substrate-binding protein n=1 Tax=Flexivirga sp. TaxID=1962927 RepID=UPI002C8EE550|nr:glycine betaine ABC transporter substrate-binding protein [Flexivirga sp.]HWC22619.1 glycine betaine ABC transporter substrate-binding protein [Flexivirga sp.]
MENTRRNVLGGLAALGVGGLLSACGTAGSSGGGSKGSDGGSGGGSGVGAEVGHKIIGIEPGAGLTMATQRMLKAYGLTDWTLQTSTTASMLAALKKATDAKKPIIVTLWRPHWAYSAFPIKDLKDPKGAMGKPDGIYAIGTKSFATDFPEVNAMVKNFHMTDATLAPLEELVLRKHKDDPAAGVDAWLKTNKSFVDGLSKGVTAKAGKKSINIGYINWDEDVATTHLWKKILEGKGYTVKMTQVSDAGPVYVGLSKGDVDLYLDSWLPATHKTYWAKYGKDLTKIVKWYDSAPLTIAVPKYMKIDSLEDLKG